MAELSVDLFLPVKPLTNDPELYSELITVYNAIRILSQAFDDIVNEVILTAFETIAIGNLLAVYNDAGIGKLRKALDAASPATIPIYTCIGFAATSANAGQSVLCKIRARYPQYPAGTLTPGTRYYLSATTAGLLTTVVGNQLVGIAQDDTTLLWRAQL